MMVRACEGAIFAGSATQLQAQLCMGSASRHEEAAWCAACIRHQDLL
jgi:hypothetical protein